jgi:hypothetical protein
VQLDSLEPTQLEQAFKEDQKPAIEELKSGHYSVENRSNPIEILGAAKRQSVRILGKPEAKDMIFSRKKSTDEHDSTSGSSSKQLENKFDETKPESSEEPFFYFEDPLADEFSGAQPP